MKKIPQSRIPQPGTSHAGAVATPASTRNQQAQPSNIGRRIPKPVTVARVGTTSGGHDAKILNKRKATEAFSPQVKNEVPVNLAPAAAAAAPIEYRTITLARDNTFDVLENISVKDRTRNDGVVLNETFMPPPPPPPPAAGSTLNKTIDIKTPANRPQQLALEDKNNNQNNNHNCSVGGRQSLRWSAFYQDNLDAQSSTPTSSAANNSNTNYTFKVMETTRTINIDGGGPSNEVNRTHVLNGPHVDGLKQAEDSAGRNETLVNETINNPPSKVVVLDAVNKKDDRLRLSKISDLSLSCSFELLDLTSVPKTSTTTSTRTESNSCEVDDSLGILTPDQMKEMDVFANRHSLELALQHANVIGAGDGGNLVQFRLEQTPSPEELPLDPPAMLPSVLADAQDLIILDDTLTEESCNKPAEVDVEDVEVEMERRTTLVGPSKMASSSSSSAVTASTATLSNESVITSVTSINSVDTGYQGDGEMSRPGSRNADNNNNNNGLKSLPPVAGGEGGSGQAPADRPTNDNEALEEEVEQGEDGLVLPAVPIVRRPEPMTDSDFFTESDADDILNRGDRRAQIIDGQLFGPKLMQDIFVVPGHAQAVADDNHSVSSVPNSMADTNSCTESSGIFTYNNNMINAEHQPKMASPRPNGPMNQHDVAMMDTEASEDNMERDNELQFDMSPDDRTSMSTTVQSSPHSDDSQQRLMADCGTNVNNKCDGIIVDGAVGQTTTPLIREHVVDNGGSSGDHHHRRLNNSSVIIDKEIVNEDPPTTPQQSLERNDSSASVESGAAATGAGARERTDSNKSATKRINSKSINEVPARSNSTSPPHSKKKMKESQTPKRVIAKKTPNKWDAVMNKIAQYQVQPKDYKDVKSRVNSAAKGGSGGGSNNNSDAESVRNNSSGSITLQGSNNSAKKKVAEKGHNQLALAATKRVRMNSKDSIGENDVGYSPKSHNSSSSINSTITRSAKKREIRTFDHKQRELEANKLNGNGYLATHVTSAAVVAKTKLPSQVTNAKPNPMIPENNQNSRPAVKGINQKSVSPLAQNRQQTPTIVPDNNNNNNNKQNNINNSAKISLTPVKSLHDHHLIINNNNNNNNKRTFSDADGSPVLLAKLPLREHNNRLANVNNNSSSITSNHHSVSTTTTTTATAQANLRAANGPNVVAAKQSAQHLLSTLPAAAAASPTSSPRVKLKNQLNAAANLLITDHHNATAAATISCASKKGAAADKKVLEAMVLLKKHHFTIMDEQQKVALDQVAADREARLRAMEIDLNVKAQGVAALGALVNYLVHHYDAFNSPGLKQQLEQTRVHLRDACQSFTELEQRLGEQEHKYQTQTIQLEDVERNYGLLQRASEEERNEARQQLEAMQEAFARVQMERAGMQSQLNEIMARENELRDKVMASEMEYDGKLKVAAMREKELEEQVRQLQESLDASATAAATAADGGGAVAVNQQPHSTLTRNNLQVEVDSLRSVLELKQNENAELRRTNECLQRTADDLLGIEVKWRGLQSKVQDLQFQLKAKTEHDTETQRELEMVRGKLNDELKTRHRLVIHNEELKFKLKDNSERYQKTFAALSKSFHGTGTMAAAALDDDGGGMGYHHDSSTPNTSGTIVVGDTTNPVSPKIKGIVETSDAVSWILEIDDEEQPSVQAVRPAALRRAGSYRSKGGNRTQNALSQSTSAASILRQISEQLPSATTASRKAQNAETALRRRANSMGANRSAMSARTAGVERTSGGMVLRKAAGKVVDAMMTDLSSHPPIGTSSPYKKDAMSVMTEDEDDGEEEGVDPKESAGEAMISSSNSDGEEILSLSSSSSSATIPVAVTHKCNGGPRGNETSPSVDSRRRRSGRMLRQHSPKIEIAWSSSIDDADDDEEEGVDMNCGGTKNGLNSESIV